MGAVTPFHLVILMADNKKITEFPRATPSGGFELVAATSTDNYKVSYDDFSEYSSINTKSGTFLDTLTVSGVAPSTGDSGGDVTPEGFLGWSGAPPSTNAPGSSGDIAFDEDYFYIRVGDSPNEGDEKVIEVSLGAHFTLFLSNSGKVYGCGANTYAQLGNGASPTHTLYPTYITGDDVIMIRSSNDDSLCLTKDGDVYAWGRNEWGGLGLGNKTITPYPTYVTGGVTGLSMGNRHTLFQSGHTILGCGQNLFRKYGPNTSDSPIFVTGDVAIGQNTFSAGTHHSLYINKDDGYYYGQGLNQHHAFAGDTIALPATFIDPIRCSGNTVQVAASSQMSIMLDNAGNGYTIGYGGYGGQLNGSSSNEPNPRKFSGDIAMISATCINATTALKTNGDLFNGGNNSAGKLGRGNVPAHTLGYATGNVSGIPIQGCANNMLTNGYITSAGGAFLCGSNVSGQLGTGALVPVNTQGTNTFFYTSGRNDVSNCWKRASLSSF